MKDRTLLLVILAVAIATLALEVKLASKAQDAADLVQKPIDAVKGFLAKLGL